MEFLYILYDIRNPNSYSKIGFIYKYIFNIYGVSTVEIIVYYFHDLMSTPRIAENSCPANCYVQNQIRCQSKFVKM